MVVLKETCYFLKFVKDNQLINLLKLLIKNNNGKQQNV